MWDGNLRQNNLHMARPFSVLESVDLVLDAYEYRYQREFGNILRALAQIIRLGRGNITQTLATYLTLQLSAMFSALGMESLAHLASFPIRRHRVEKLVSGMLNVRFKIAETTVGGAALDVDNEKDYIILSVMYRDWVNMINAA
jgi:hypothetical protein